MTVPIPHDQRTVKERKTRKKARENVEKWGQQPPGDILAALAEEMGELLDELITDDCPDLDGPEYDPLGALWSNLQGVRADSIRVQQTLDDNYGPDTAPNLPVREDMDVQAVRGELYDLMALCYQLDWALYQGVRADQ